MRSVRFTGFPYRSVVTVENEVTIQGERTQDKQFDSGRKSEVAIGGRIKLTRNQVLCYTACHYACGR